MSKKASKTVLVRRDSRTGHFVPRDSARAYSATVTVERVAKPGYVSAKSSATIRAIDKRYGKVLDRLAKR